MTPQDWIDLAGILLGGGGGWRLLGHFTRISGALERLERGQRTLVRQHRRLVDQVNDHEARMQQNGM